MNFQLTRELLDAAKRQPSGFLNVFGRVPVHEVELMAEAGFVEASFAEGGSEPSAVINCLTTSGEKLLRVLRADKPAFTKTSVPNERYL